MLKKSLCISIMALTTVMSLVTNSFGKEWPNVIFTEDFEGGKLQGWDVEGTVKVQEEHAHEGKALKFGPVPVSAGINRHDVKSDANQVYIVFFLMQTMPEDNSFTLYYTTQGKASSAAAKNRMNFKVVEKLLSPVAEGWGDPNATMGVGIDVPIQANEWHQIGVVIDYSRGYDLYFDGLKTPVEKDIPFRDKNNEETFYFIVWDDEPHEGLAYLDDIVVGEGEMPTMAVSHKEKVATTWGRLKAR